MYKINGNPLGIQCPQSAFETIHGIVVDAQKIGNKIIVAKMQIVEKIKQKRSIWVDFWKRSDRDTFEFNETDCHEVNA